ncbi:related to heat shock transcription factor HSF21 [Cephalotrichum gorgonifer]|uniref:Related to heat shock transcription factor HSF21 n=1 Tax=Cephalotrichum gorgonifer TaxID=2041049 RepID=A0AAE8N095_9PEZI|nr:related to heat shock transcription factor HSF21 [Cephalotrichum gorgonifer]
MAAATDASHRNSLAAESAEDSLPSRIVPIPTPTPMILMSAPSPGDPMDVSSPVKSSASMPPESNHDGSDGGNGNPNGAGVNGSAPPSSAPTSASSSAPSAMPNSNSNEQLATSNSNSMPAPPTTAAAAVHQPKIVQTAFIHKLYNMLEDHSIHHLISWSPNEDSFVMSPTPDFSKVLAQYFKHTNISSFVRQLNMYGFHKVSDVFHTASPDTALWEFKHGGGNFKRGDLVGLREIKRRASKHSLVHREYNSQKPSPLQPGTPAEPIQMPHDSAEARLVGIEHTLYDMGMRLQRSEESAHFMHVKHQAISEMLSKSMQFNQELTRLVLGLVPSPDHPVHRDMVALQSEIHRQSEVMRAMDEPQEQFANARQYFSNIDNGPVSPRQLAQDDPRRNTLNVPQPGRGNAFYRPPVPSNLSTTPRRYGSFGANTSQTSPSSLRPPPPPPGPPHPLSHVESAGNLARRHTAADIRAPGWQPNHGPYPAGGPPPPPPVSQWPPSPSRVAPEDQHIRDSFSGYSLQAASQHLPRSRPATPPPPVANGGGAETFAGWSFGSAGRGENKNLVLRDGSGPPSRRGSMAHILNPADTREKDGEDDDSRGEEDRKRRRKQ